MEVPWLVSCYFSQPVLANQIHEAITNAGDLNNTLIRVNRPSK